MSPAARVHFALRLLQSMAIKIYKNLKISVQHNRKSYHATLGPAKRWIHIMHEWGVSQIFIWLSGVRRSKQ